jgi:hypothetical protein
MTDDEIVKIARKLTEILHDTLDLIHEIEYSDHPNAKQVAKALREECLFYAWPTHVVHPYLEDPEVWELVDKDDGSLLNNLGIRHKGATLANEQRRR